MDYEERKIYFERYERSEDEGLSPTERARMHAFRERQECCELKYNFLAKEPLSYEQAVRILQAIIL